MPFVSLVTNFMSAGLMGKLEMGDGAHGWGVGVGMEAPEKETMLPDWARRREGDGWLCVRLTFVYFQHY